MNVRTVELEQPTTRIPPVVPREPDRPVATTPGPGGGAVLLWAALFAVSLLLAIIGRIAGAELFAVGGGFGVVFFGIGGAAFQLRPSLDIYARLTGSVLVGFSVLLLAGMLMADIRGLWSPLVAALMLVIPAIFVHAAGVIEVLLPPDRGGRPPAEDRAELAQALLTGFADAEPPARPIRRYDEAQAETSELDAVGERRFTARLGWQHRLSMPLIVSGTVLWLATALATRNPNPGYWGLLATIDPLWYLGLVLLLVGFAFGRGSELRAGLATLSFGLATTLTPALVYGAPREQAAAKQMEIVQYVLLHHHIQPTGGIYQAFSTLFSGIAGLASLIGVHGLTGHMSLWGMATYWPVLLVLVRVAGLRFLMGRLLSGTARQWCGVMLVLLVDSLGADYFSPQAVGYVMAIGVVAFALNGRTPRPLNDRFTFVLLLLAGMALAPTHELSPYMAAGALVVLAIFGQAPWWTCLPVGVPALAWAGVVHSVISANFNFGSLFNLTNFRPPVTIATPGLHRMAIVGTQSDMLLAAMLILIGLGAIGFLSNIRQRWAWAYALCPIVGIAFIAINPYGNEGIFRATLFAIPWMAVLAMRMPHPRQLLPRVLAHRDVFSIALAAGLCGLLVTFLLAAYAMDGTNVLARSDVKVVSYLLHRPAHDDFVLSVGSAANPADGANFTFRYQTLEWSQVVGGQRALQKLHPTAADATALAARYAQVAAAHGATHASPLYLIWARSSRLYTNAYGLQSSSEMTQWLRLLQTSPSWKLVDRSGSSYLFQLQRTT
jgi:hypothetical protein